MSGGNAYSGRGIHNNSGTITLSNSTVSGNSARSGGGIHNDKGTATLSNSTISGNSATNSSGGGILNRAGTTTLSNSTVSGNLATSGGGITSVYGSIFLTHSTVSGNSTTSDGGGLFIIRSSDLIINHSIISGNSAEDDGAEIRLSASDITTADFNVFGHSGLTNAQAFSGFTPASSNINTTSDGGTPVTLTSILNPTLADNGGFTQTHALVVESPAIDAVPAQNCTARLDQRAKPRPVDGGSGTAHCDSGAYEFGTITPNALDIDGNGKTDALTDGLLIIRYLIGLTGNTLIDGVVAKNATRITAAEIEAWLLTQKTSNILEIDGNTNTGALTDGLLLMRYLFGLRGHALISEVVDNDATRTSAAEIEARIQSLLNL